MDGFDIEDDGKDIQHYTELGWPALQKGGFDAKLVGYFTSDVGCAS